MNHSLKFRRILKPESGSTPFRLPLFGNCVAAGFPSPADDYLEGRLSLDEHLVPHKDATFFVRARGSSMLDAGIHDGDLMVVDKSLTPSFGDIVVAVLDGGFTVKYLARRGKAIVLKPANAQFGEIEFKDGQELQIWGVVTASVREYR